MAPERDEGQAMEFIVNILYGVLNLLEIALWVFMLIVAINGVMAFMTLNPESKFVKFIHRLSNPILERVKVKFPKLHHENIDYSPWAVLTALLIIKFLVLFPVMSLFHK